VLRWRPTPILQDQFKLVIPFAAGGVGDIFGRLLSEQAGRELGQTIVIDNRTGANSVIGTSAVARAKPDGYTILQMATANVIVTALQEVPFDFHKDFIAVIGVGDSPLGLAVPNQTEHQDHGRTERLWAFQSQRPDLCVGWCRFAWPSVRARLVHELNVKGTHVPYRGNSAGVESLLGGQTDFSFASVIDELELAKAGKLRILAVTSVLRMPNLPDVPTMSELGFRDFTPSIWYGYDVPTGTPQAIVDRLAMAFAKAASQPGSSGPPRRIRHHDQAQPLARNSHSSWSMNTSAGRR